MSISIKQLVEDRDSSVDFGFQPADTSVLDLIVEQHNVASPSGCATTWTKIAESPDQWRGVGPFSGMHVTLTAGRTPPQVDAVLTEVGP